ncbi:MAG TPA: hypothetical protein PLZ80_13000, partial [Planctomycetota bacterium]|nr:hypothetical protein [Planctomycetota bacterium]
MLMTLNRSLRLAAAVLAPAVFVCAAAEPEASRPAAGASARKRVDEPAASPPAAEPSPGEPVLSFAWVSDLHLDAATLDAAAAAFRWIDATLAPDFV